VVTALKVLSQSFHHQSYLLLDSHVDWVKGANQVQEQFHPVDNSAYKVQNGKEIAGSMDLLLSVEKYG
jgi:hypothetical protein